MPDLLSQDRRHFLLGSRVVQRLAISPLALFESEA
jgi:hypothetical protein